MSITLASSPLLLILCALVAAALTYWSYRQTAPPLPPVKRLFLGVLRFAALFLVLFLLFEPIIRRIESESRPPVLAVLVDDSQSLTLGGETADTSDIASDQSVRDLLRQLPTGQIEGHVRVYRFNSAVEKIPGRTENWVDSLRFDGERTNIARALDFVREDLKNENLRSVLLISDGQYNTGRNPLYQAERYPVPILAAVVGDTTSKRDIQVRTIVSNEIAYAGTEQPVQVRLRSDDYGAERVTVTLSQGGQVLDSETIQLPNGTAEVPVELTYTPPAPGLQQFTVAVSRLPGELTYRNNIATVTARVLDRKKSILLVSAAPDPDLAAMRQVLEQNADMKVLTLVQKTTGTFYDDAALDSLDEVDAIVLAGFPGPAGRPDQIKRIVDAANKGTPLFFILTRQTDLTLLRQYFSDVLPVHPETIRQGFFDASFVPTTAAERHPVLEIPNATRDAWHRLPPIIYNDSRWQVSPDARVLATIEVRGVALNDPLLIVRQRSGSRSAALLGAGTWRWKNIPEDLSEVGDYWPRLFSNAIQWITTRDENRRVRVEPIEEMFAGGESALFQGQVYDESLRPVDGAAVDVILTTPDGTEYPYRMESVGNGRYTLDAGALPEGTYRYTAKAQRGDTEIGTDEGSFAVGSLNLEFRETRANTSLMQQLALRSGGTLLSSDQLGMIPSVLEASEMFTADVHEIDRTTELRHVYILALFIIVLLSVEWFLRKRSGLV